MNYSAALTADFHNKACKHLLRPDGQEDLCFALWSLSQGCSRKSALIRRLILPQDGEREVHGNASFSAQYFHRVIGEALKENAGIAFLHSHPSPGWQDMSEDDINAETTHAAAVKGATGLPLVGLTVGKDQAWSARFWEKIGPRKYVVQWCQSVRVIGDDLKITFNERLLPTPKFRKNLGRTVSAWGSLTQAKLARLRMGIVGVGSVGMIVAETLARMGIVRLKLIDFDSVETINLDRLLHCTEKDAKKRKAKVRRAAEVLKHSATADGFIVQPIEWAVTEEVGFREALDCDLLFSCVDKPWARHVLNFIAYAHLIPVVDGGIKVTQKKDGSLRGANWKVHVVGPGRRCLVCLGQYDPGLVESERQGDLDDQSYIESLPADHSMKRNENVFAFSLNLASLEVLQILSMVVSPLGVSNIGEQNYHFVTGKLGCNENGQCANNCPYPELTALGDHSGYVITGRHLKAEAERERRKKERSWWRKILSKYIPD